MSRQPTAQGISALLQKAGFERSVKHATAVPGWHSRTCGFVARGSGGTVTVYHEDGKYNSTEADRRASAELEGRYADAIEAAGYAVERSEGGFFGPLVVRALPEDGGNGR